MNSTPQPTPRRSTDSPAKAAPQELAPQEVAPRELDQRELDQLAFRYIASELTADELRTFEDLLATDQGAREAVAAAVELAQAIAFVETTQDSPAFASAATVDRVAANRPLTSDRRSWWPALGWMAVGSVACAALIFLADQWSLDQVGSSGSDRQLAMLWSETRGTAHWFIAGDDDETGEVEAASTSARRSDALSGRAAEVVASDHMTEDENAESETAGSESSLEESAAADVDSTESWDDPMSSPMFDTPSWMLAAVAETSASSRSTIPSDQAPQTGNEER